MTKRRNAKRLFGIFAFVLVIGNFFTAYEGSAFDSADETALVASPKILAGTINYRAVIDTGYASYGLRCEYDTEVIGTTTYTINGYIGVSYKVSCIETDYIWTLTDTADPHHTKNVTGAKYYITDAKAAEKGRTYYEGYTPNDWGTQAIAVWFHNEMFGYTAWETVSQS